MNLILEPYQEEAVEWIVSRERSALFTSVGLGKTATVLEAFKRLLGQNKVQHMLVVAPLRVARWTWPMEIAKWDNFSWMKTCQLRTNIHSAHVYLINYESLHKVPTKRFDMVVFDELTKLKNPKGKRFKAFMPLLQHIPYRVGLTGTPAANSLEDLFGQVLALDDGQRLGRSFYQFRQRWFRQVDYMGYKWEPKADAEQNLRDKLKGLALVQSSEDFSDVADADVIDIDVPLTGEVADRYRELQKEMLLELGDQVVTAVNAAILVNKLLQYTGGHVYDEEGVAAHVHGEKLKALAKLVDPASPLLVGVNYRSERDAIAEVIPGAEVWD
ncbi:MAG: SNF2-related protein, partial [Ilumatobacteraceae bacterium]